jgi:mono/diheme cytochrome c family protein
MPRTHHLITMLLSAVLLVSAGASAALGTVRAQQSDPKSIVDRVYSVVQAERGEQRFKASCSSCHTPSSFGGGSFAERWSGQTMAEVFDFVSNAMPENDPGGLKQEQYVDVLAYILSVNGYPVGNDELPADRVELKKLEIVPNGK